MRFLLFVEGHTEKAAVRDFIRRWLDKRLSKRVGIDLVNLKGSGHFAKDIAGKVAYYLGRPDSKETIAAIGLLDLYKGAPFPPELTTVDERYEWGVAYFEDLVGNPRFKMFFAVHETEAWLLSDPSLFPREIRQWVEKLASRPETVDFDQPPAKRLDGFYQAGLKRKYKKTVHGVNLFAKLDPEFVHEKCPYFSSMLDNMLALAREAAL
ncbi:MAG: DUF4276 family protein [Phycisphaerae bacterium]